MSTNVRRLTPSAETLPAEHLGPAEVCSFAGNEVELKLPDGRRRQAQLALAFSYSPAAGDTVLAIGNDDGAWVIGVLASEGCASLSFPGDMHIEAAGELCVRGAKGVRIEGPQLSVEVGRLEMAARAVSQRFEQLTQRVSDLLSVRAGQTHTIVHGASFTRAESSTLLTKEKVSINGKSIHLG
jgi:hypothetical protein